MRRAFLILFVLFGISEILAQATMSANFPASLVQGNSVLIEVKINKGTAANFAKYQMEVPEGLVLTEIDSKGGNFTFENNHAKIVWVSIPPDPEFSIKMKLYPSGSSPASATIIQKLAYLQDGSKKEIEAPTVIISILGAENIMGSRKKQIEASKTEPAPNLTASKEPVKIAETPKSEPVKTEPVKAEPVKTTPPKEEAPKTESPKSEPVKATPVAKSEPIKAEPVKEEPVKAPPVAKSEPVKAEPVKIESPKTEAMPITQDLIYKIQLAASPSETVKDKFVTLGKEISVSKEDGAYKVVYGSYTSKEEALKVREELITKGFTGFLVKYQNGKRIK